MTVHWDDFFPPGTRVLALPSWRRPRLYLPAHPFSRRWEGSKLYPASRWPARIYRLSLRASAATGMKKAHTAGSGDWRLGDFAEDVLPELNSVVVLAGTPGPAQKVTAQLRAANGKVLGYLKYADKKPARRRLRQEHKMLSELPFGVGPTLIKFGPMGDGEALLSSALPGELLPATLPAPEGVIALLDRLIVPPTHPLEVHPWVRHIRSRGLPPRLHSCLEALADRTWPVAIQHGDFAPWNLLRRSDGVLGAIDWEYGTPEGFPYMDLAYYILQTSALIYRRKPLSAAQHAAEYLTRLPAFDLDSAEAHALIHLAAYDAYLKGLEDGQPESTDLQTWRRKIWQETTCHV
jgi:hypothetical protein